MSLDTACNLIIKAAFPKGKAWTPKPEGNYDLTLEATGDILKLICDRMLNARYVRDANLTYVLTDLLREYGLQKNTLLTELQQRMILEAKINRSPGGGTADDLQAALDAAGFNVQVHKNDPAVDPALFLDQSFQMVAGGDNAYAGRPDAYAARIGGELLANGSVFDQEEAYIMQAGGTIAYAGNADAVAGRFDSIDRIPIEYTIPTDSDDWPFVFFVGGDATRNVSGELTDIEAGEVPNQRQEEFKRIILSIKPLYTWAGLIITYT